MKSFKKLYESWKQKRILSQIIKVYSPDPKAKKRTVHWLHKQMQENKKNNSKK